MLVKLQDQENTGKTNFDTVNLDLEFRGLEDAVNEEKKSYSCSLMRKYAMVIICLLSKNVVTSLLLPSITVTYASEACLPLYIQYMVGYTERL